MLSTVIQHENTAASAAGHKACAKIESQFCAFHTPLEQIITFARGLMIVKVLSL